MPLPSLDDDSGEFLAALDALRPRDGRAGGEKRFPRPDFNRPRLMLLAGVVMAIALAAGAVVRS